MQARHETKMQTIISYPRSQDVLVGGGFNKLAKLRDAIAISKSETITPLTD